MKTFLEVTLTVKLTLEESLALETELASMVSPTAAVMREALRSTNTTASRLVATGAIPARVA